MEAEAVLTKDTLPKEKIKLIFKSRNTGTFIEDLLTMKEFGKAFWFPDFIKLMVRGGHDIN